MIAKKEGNKVIILLDILTSNETQDLLSIFCSQTKYQLKDFIALIKLENKDKHSIKAHYKNKHTETLAHFYDKVKEWVKDKDIKDQLMTLFD